MGSKAGSSPDYSGAAAADAEASKTIATRGTYANRPDMTTPFGTSKWNATPGIDEATGESITRWGNTVELNDQLQGAFDAQNRQSLGRSNLALGLMGTANQELGQKLDWQGLPDAAPTPVTTDFYGERLPQMGSLADPSQFSEEKYGAQPLQAGQLQKGLDTGGLNDVNAGGGYQDKLPK